MGKTPEFLEKTPEFLDKTPEFLEKTPEFLDKTPEFLDKTSEFLGKIPEFLNKTPEFLDKIPEFFKWIFGFPVTSPGGFMMLVFGADGWIGAELVQGVNRFADFRVLLGYHVVFQPPRVLPIACGPFF
ncbi:hypothetical protein AGMMS49942_02990 [Spirochaetia bacterium]|nr:hypothetical protein AGMMS49942_02990 [Spirochaetia bacterium]